MASGREGRPTGQSLAQKVIVAHLASGRMVAWEEVVEGPNIAPLPRRGPVAAAIQGMVQLAGGLLNWTKERGAP